MGRKRTVKDIVAETISNYLKELNMVKEYKNPTDCETVRVCADQLEALYNRIVKSGLSRHEITIEKLGNVIKELRKIQEMMIL